MKKILLIVFIILVTIFFAAVTAFYLVFYGSWKYQLSDIRFVPKNYFHPVLAAPPMGWNGWNHYRCDPQLNEQTFIETVNSIVKSGMKDAGYTYVNLDDCWQVDRDAKGVIVVDKTRFPKGIKYLADYVHEKGLKFGIYTSAGRITCEKRPGSYGYELKDVDTYAEWGVDYVKVDFCGIDYLDTFTEYQKWRKAIDAARRPMVLSIAIADIDKIDNNNAWIWGRESGDIWRTARDLTDDWTDILRVMDRNSQYSEYSGRGGWNDADMLQVGNGSTTNEEDRTHFSMWAMMASPLIAGNDVRTMSPETKDILTNKEIISIDKDPLGIQATLVSSQSGSQVWMRPLVTRGERAVALLNRSEEEAIITVRAQDLGLRDLMLIRDVWKHKNVGFQLKEYSQVVQPHQTVVLKVRGLDSVNLLHFPNKYVDKKLKTGFLIDQSYVSQYRTDLEELKRDGTRINVYTFSDIHYYPDGDCNTLSTSFKVSTHSGETAQMIFKVYGDGHLLYQSDVQTNGGLPGSTQVKIDKVRDLNLRAVPVNHRNDQLHIGVWEKSAVKCLINPDKSYTPDSNQN